ncbi:glutamate synthase-related protein [Vampirovibrio sp.]|uniref:glutamate synthase-related protein n=1 Tax=Vampirovibrio sp. TaxID=2717857 RepID=UPI0035943E63
MVPKNLVNGRLASPDVSLPIHAFISTASPSQKPIAEALVKLIQNRARGFNPPDTFGSSQNVQALGHESLLPALVKSKSMAESPPKITIGSRQCQKPYPASYLNASALSFGPMGKPFILALNQAARQGGFYQNTGEAGLSPFHLGRDVNIEDPDFNANAFFATLTPEQLEETGDLVWQLGNGYFGCRNPDGSFAPDLFEQKALLSPVKMIEIKLSQGVEPAAHMPVKEVTLGMTRLMGIEQGAHAKLESAHSAFSTPVELLRFVKTLRALSGGKPIGVKMGVSHRHYVFALCKAMRKTGILLDFITVDGMEAGTAAAGAGTLGFTGTALHDAVLFVHNALTGCHLRCEVKIIASGQVFTEHQMVSLLARGADSFATARAMLLAVGCDQQLECQKGNCTRGIATQEPHLLSKFNIEQNVKALYQFHRLTIESLQGLIAIAGLEHPQALQPFHLQKRVSISEVLLLDEIYHFIKPGSLLSWVPWRFPREYARAWRKANPVDPFTAPRL